LVFKRGAVARSDSLNLPVVKRALADMCPDKVADAIVGMHQPAAHLVVQRLGRVKRKWDGLGVTRLLGEHAFPYAGSEIDAVPLQARRRAGLQSPHLEAASANRI